MKIRLLIAALLFPALASAQTVVFETLSMTDPSQHYYRHQICCYGSTAGDGFAYNGPAQELHSVSLWAAMYYPGNLKVSFFEGAGNADRTLLQSWSVGRILTPDTLLMFDPGKYLQEGKDYTIQLTTEFTDFFQDMGSAASWEENYYAVNTSLGAPWSKVFIVRTVPETAALPLLVLAATLLMGRVALRRGVSMAKQAQRT